MYSRGTVSAGIKSNLAGDGDAGSKDAAIFRLKQEIATLMEEKESTIYALQERNVELKSEIERLRSQLLLSPVKKEFKGMTINFCCIKVSAD